jgi:hypothetical protein
MRLLASALAFAFALLCVPAWAQTTPAAPATTASPATAPKPAPKVVRPPFTDRFDTANASHDGKLTLDQARKGKMRGVVKYYSAIDTDKKGYITKADVDTFRKTDKGKKAVL